MKVGLHLCLMGTNASAVVYLVVVTVDFTVIAAVVIVVLFSLTVLLYPQFLCYKKNLNW